MLRLTEKDYWDAKYAPGRGGPDGAGAPQRGLIASIKRLLGPRVVEYMRHYSEYLLWDVLYADNLPRTPNTSART
jgi:hypothetical protein